MLTSRMICITPPAQQGPTDAAVLTALFSFQKNYVAIFTVRHLFWPNLYFIFPNTKFFILIIADFIIWPKSPIFLGIIRRSLRSVVKLATLLTAFI